MSNIPNATYQGGLSDADRTPCYLWATVGPPGFGLRSGLSELEVGFVENGSKPVRTEDLLCLAKGLGVSPAAFFEGW